MSIHPCVSRLRALRESLRSLGLAGMVIPSGDEFLGEYVPESARRLTWLTGFTGSAGTAVALMGKAAFFTDGRYTLQAAAELDSALFSIYNIADLTPEKWLAQALSGKFAIGIDPKLHTLQALQRFEKDCPEVTLHRLAQNPIDALWQDRPALPASPPCVHGAEYAGMTVVQKCAQVAGGVAKAGADVALLILSDSVNWLLNIRAHDLEFSPLLLAYGLLSADGGVKLYVSPERVSHEVRAHLGSQVQLRDPALLEADLRALGGQRVLVDMEQTPLWFIELLQASKAELVKGQDPCLLLKAKKNDVELAGIRRAHERDGLAVTRFLHWLSQHEHDGLSEIDVAARLLEFRQQSSLFDGPSFATIAGFGANGAIVHYRATEATKQTLAPGNLLLLDSGGQYPDGTTDITRTVVIGMPTEEHRRHFTTVLKGHIALARVRFPAGTTGSQLDAIARAPLWQAGLDYDHGTGHGVGCYMNVHEGPQRISKRSSPVALEAGMIISNEPGYYKAGEYGIRIETLVEVHARGADAEGREWLGFHTLTLAPFDCRLIDPALLDESERGWLNDYHARVLKVHAPHLQASAKQWLEAVCAPVT